MKTLNKILLCFLLFFAAKLVAQDNTLYMLHQLPQANMLNPAVDFPCKYYIELPVISSLKLAYNNTSFTYKEFIRQGTGSMSDSLVLDFDNIYNNLGRNNAIYTEIENVLVGAGFHWRKYFITARLFHAHSEGLFYQKDLVRLKHGNWDPASNSPVNFDLSRNEVNAVSYWGISLGISQQFTRALRLGARISYLNGILNYSTRKSDLKIITTEQPFVVDINSSYDARSSFPAEFETDASGRVYLVRPITENILKNYIFNRNRGASVDFGLVYDYSPDLVFSASILNLGFIRWKSNAYLFDANSAIHLEGTDLEQYTTNTGTDLIEMLRDTVLHTYRTNMSPGKYFTALPVKIMAGSNYRLSNKIDLGLTGKLFIYNYATFPSLTATFNVKPVSFILISGSISYANRTIKNIGFALIIGNERLNFYAISDNMPVNYVKDTGTGLIFPYQSRSVNLRFGLNLMFGCGKYKKPVQGAVCPAYD